MADPRWDYMLTGSKVLRSPEPKAQKCAYSIPVELSSVCVCVNIFKLEYLRNHWANHNEILSESSLG